MQYFVTILMCNLVYMTYFLTTRSVSRHLGLKYFTILNTKVETYV